MKADSKGELLKWAPRCPTDDGDVLEIRRIVFGEAEFAKK